MKIFIEKYWMILLQFIIGIFVIIAVCHCIQPMIDQAVALGRNITLFTLASVVFVMGLYEFPRYSEAGTSVKGYYRKYFLSSWKTVTLFLLPLIALVLFLFMPNIMPFIVLSAVMHLTFPYHYWYVAQRQNNAHRAPMVS